MCFQCHGNVLWSLVIVQRPPKIVIVDDLSNASTHDAKGLFHKSLRLVAPCFLEGVDLQHTGINRRSIARLAYLNINHLNN